MRTISGICVILALSGCASAPDNVWKVIRCHSDSPIAESLTRPTLLMMERLIDRDPVFKLSLANRTYEYDSHRSYFVVEKPNTATFGIGLPHRSEGNLFSPGPYVEVNYAQHTAMAKYMIAVDGKNQFDQDEPNSTYVAVVRLEYACHEEK